MRTALSRSAGGSKFWHSSGALVKYILFYSRKITKSLLSSNGPLVMHVVQSTFWYVPSSIPTTLDAVISQPHPFRIVHHAFLAEVKSWAHLLVRILDTHNISPPPHIPLDFRDRDLFNHRRTRANLSRQRSQRSKPKIRKKPHSCMSRGFLFFLSPIPLTGGRRGS